MNASLTVVCALCALCVFGPVHSQETTQEQYVEKYSDLAIKEMAKSGIPASITLAQGVLESRYGNSALAQNARNHFGIKCHKSWDGKGYYMDDDTKDECFRVYKTVEASFHDHSEFLTTRERYANLFELDIKDYKGWAHGLKKAGYATNPRYARLLIDLIERLDLARYDGVGVDYMLAQKESERRSKERKKQLAQQGEVLMAADAAMSDATATSHTLIEVNGLKAVRMGEDESLYAIAVEYNMQVGKLRRLNDVTSDAPIRAGLPVFLQKKKSRSVAEIHTMELGQTLHEVSQMYGVRLEKLYGRNRMLPPTEPAKGALVYLTGKRDDAPGTRTLADVMTERRLAEEAAKTKALEPHIIAKEDLPVAETSPPPPPTPQEEIPNAHSAPTGHDRKAPAAQGPTGTVDKSFYEVEPGDTLYSIARWFHVTVDELRGWNELENTTISIGQVLVVAK